jgi:hypothetical protein
VASVVDVERQGLAGVRCYIGTNEPPNQNLP